MFKKGHPYGFVFLLLVAFTVTTAVAAQTKSALTHETITHHNSPEADGEMNPAKYLARAQAYAQQAKAQHGK